MLMVWQQETNLARNPNKLSRASAKPVTRLWYGMVWYGMVWYGMVWYGMAFIDIRGNTGIPAHLLL